MNLKELEMHEQNGWIWIGAMVVIMTVVMVGMNNHSDRMMGISLLEPSDVTFASPFGDDLFSRQSGVGIAKSIEAPLPHSLSEFMLRDQLKHWHVASPQSNSEINTRWNGFPKTIFRESDLGRSDAAQR